MANSKETSRKPAKNAIKKAAKKAPKKEAKKAAKPTLHQHIRSLLDAANKDNNGTPVKTIVVKKKDSLTTHIQKFNKGIQAMPQFKDFEFGAFDAKADDDEIVFCCPKGKKCGPYPKSVCDKG